MTIPVISELQLIGVADRGVPNKERVLLRPVIALNLQNFILTVGLSDARATRILPVNNFIFYFEDIVVEPMSWVAVYTGPGQSEESRLPTTLEKAYSYHWGHNSVLFSDPKVLPVLFQVAAIGFARADLPGWQQPQLAFPMLTEQPEMTPKTSK
jgi:hypothetical protein